MPRTVIHQQIDLIEVPIACVWSVLNCFGAIKTWMPTLDSVTTDGEDIGSVRTIYWSGNLIKERLEIRDHKAYTMSYQMLDPTGLPMKGGFGTVSLESKDEDETQITWTADAEEIDEAGLQAVRAILKPFITISIEGLRESLTRPSRPLF
ncbi:hypothetical protein F5884DRAFT_856161 [Xylogone sp. PMI_703]|nr:hypothetical protein F5884DRAFT_856161 [Xylogone sp. PMI_703]